MAFVDKMAALAEAEQHHPDFCVHYSQVDVTLWTHIVGGSRKTTSSWRRKSTTLIA